MELLIQAFMALFRNRGAITEIHELKGKLVCLESLDEQIITTIQSVLLDKQRKRIVVSISRTYRDTESGGFYEYFYYHMDSEDLWLQELTYPDWDLNHKVGIQSIEILD